VTVRIVTDSLSDLASGLIGNLDITVVPLTVLFGHETFLDRVTISTDEFYHRLGARRYLAGFHPTLTAGFCQYLRQTC